MKVLEKRLRNEQSVQVWAKVYDQLYDGNQTTAEEGADPTMVLVSYKDSLNPAGLHRRDWITVRITVFVEMVLHESAASAGCERLARVCERGCGNGMLVIKIALRVSPWCAETSRSLLWHVRTPGLGTWRSTGCRAARATACGNVRCHGLREAAWGHPKLQWVLLQRSQQALSVLRLRHDFLDEAVRTSTAPAAAP